MLPESMSLVMRVAYHIIMDDTDDSRRVIDAYNDATPDQKAVVDDIFISMCGYRLCSLIEGKENA